MGSPGERKKLPAWAVVVMLLAGSALLGVLGIGAVVLFVVSKKDDIAEFGKAAFAEADAYAADHTQEECVDEVFRAYAHCGSMKCELRHGIFVERCMTAAQPSPEFCAQVPEPSSVFAVAGWAMKECKRRGYLTEQSCSRMMQSVTRGCHPSALQRRAQ